MPARPYVNHSQTGFVVLLSTIIVIAIGLGVGVSLLLLGIGATRTSFAFEQSSQAKGLATSCAEEALQQLFDSKSFTGSDTLSIGQGTCDYAVIDAGGQALTIQAQGNVGTIVRRIRVDISKVNPAITIDRWEEVADF